LEKATSTGIKILIVEDEDSVRHALSKILENYGYAVTGAHDAEAGLQAFDAGGGMDIVLTDLSLPGMSGWELADAIKERVPKTPVILLSGWDIHPDEVKKHESVTLILSKPVKIKDMLAAIKGLALKQTEDKG
jgi:DNA-binding response OmpR family regulator